MRRTLKITPLVLAVLLASCGGFSIAALRSASSSVNAFLPTLVTQQVITQAKANMVEADVNNIVAAIEKCDRDIKAITVTGNAKKIAKARAYKALATSVRAVLATRNIGGSTQLDRISAIFDGAALALEIYFNSVTGTGPESSVSSNPDKELEDKLKQAKKDLEEATKE